MKYMTFNSSCSYAGLANMLACYGVETTDRDIALAMKLPYLCAFRDGAYLSGPMLQSAEWFDLYLNPIGYRMMEETVSADRLADCLKKRRTAMLGLCTENGGRHAVVYVGTEGEHLEFWNNKWEGEDCPDTIRLTEGELRQRVGQETVVASLQRIPPQQVSLSKQLIRSADILAANLSDILKLSERGETVKALRAQLNTLFRPLFLDGITMLRLVGETELSDALEVLQCELLTALRQGAEQRILLKEHLSIERLIAAAERYTELIRRAAEETAARERATHCRRIEKTKDTFRAGMKNG